MEVEITKDNFETLRNGDLPLVVDLWATWCGPCKAISPLVSKLAEEYDGKLVVGKCDVEQNEDITMEYAVRNIPTRNSSSSPELTRSRKSCNGKTPTKCGIWPTSWP